MSSSNDDKSIEQMISFRQFIIFFKSNIRKYSFFIALTAILTALLLVAIYASLPRSKTYITSISLQLQKTGGTWIYPSGTIFSANDILSVAVLRKVYDDNKLGKRIPFDNFCKLFSLYNANMDKTLLNARVCSKLAQRNITVVDIKSIEEDYINAMNRLDTDTVGIAMAGSSFFSEQETIMLLQQVPETWFRVYSKIEPKVSRRIETVDYVNKVGAAVSTDGWLISLDRARVICEDLCDSCDDYLNSLARGKKIALPSGETIELLRAKLDDLRKNRIDPLLLLASENPNCQTPLDTVFIKSRILFLENKIHELQEKYNALTTAINILQSDNPSTAKNQPAVSGKEESLSLTIDSSFIVAISDLVMKSQSIDLRKKYADEAIQCKEEVVHLESEKNYYLSFLQATPHTDGKDMLPQEQFDKLSKAMFAELLDVCKKLNEMETLVLEDYYNSSVFFTASGETEKKVSPFIPFI